MSHEVSPNCAWLLPVGHKLHAVVPMRGWCDPAAQSTHAPWPVALL